MAFVLVCLAVLPLDGERGSGKGRHSLSGNDLWQKGLPGSYHRQFSATADYPKVWPFPTKSLATLLRIDLLRLAIPLCKLNSRQAERIRQQYRSESYPYQAQTT